jgi:hypothetical protein
MKKSIILLLLLLFTSSARAQTDGPFPFSNFGGSAAVPEMDWTLPSASASFNMTYTKTGATLHWIWPDGTTSDSNSPTVNIPAGIIRVQSKDGFGGVTQIVSSNILGGTLPTLPSGLTYIQMNNAIFTGTLSPLPSGLTAIYLYDSVFTGTLPTLPSGLTYLQLTNSTFSGTLPTLPSGLTSIQMTYSTFSGTMPVLPSGLISIYLYKSNFTGALPALPSTLTYAQLNSSPFSGTVPTLPTGLTYFTSDISTFSGTLPMLPSMLTGFGVTGSLFSGYTSGSLATQKSLTAFHAQMANVSDVNAALEDAVASLSIPGRVLCTITLAGSSPAPTGAGLTAKATLISAGWTVTTN